MKFPITNTQFVKVLRKYIKCSNHSKYDREILRELALFINDLPNILKKIRG